MKEQVLSIEQMQELIDMGVDTSSASCIWWNFADLGFTLMFLNDGRESLTIEKMKENHGAENIIPAFTLQDILEMLPYEIPSKVPDFETYSLRMVKWDDSYTLEYQEFIYETDYTKESFTCKSLLEASFNMLKWCKQNNYI